MENPRMELNCSPSLCNTRIPNFFNNFFFNHENKNAIVTWRRMYGFSSLKCYQRIFRKQPFKTTQKDTFKNTLPHAYLQKNVYCTVKCTLYSRYSPCRYIEKYRKYNTKAQRKVFWFCFPFEYMLVNRACTVKCKLMWPLAVCYNTQTRRLTWMYFICSKYVK